MSAFTEPKWNDCADCYGTGEVFDGVSPDPSDYYGYREFYKDCPTCDGTGEYWPHFFARLYWRVHYAIRHFFKCVTDTVSYCPDCKKADRRWWWRVGNHEGCIPF